MVINSLPDTDGSRCTLSYEEPDQWLRATWRGFIDSDEAYRGADNYLNQLAKFQCRYLLNDNVNLRGPWFDSMDWLLRIWAPQAARMGLRYVAHVVQADTQRDIITTSPPVRSCLFELQFFDYIDEATEWLRTCQARDRANVAAQPTAGQVALPHLPQQPRP